MTFSPAIAAVLVVRTERLSPKQVAGFALALGGVAVIVILGAGTGAELEASDPLKASVALLTPIAWALYTLISKPLAARHGSVGPVAVAMLIGSVTLIPLLPHALQPVDDLTGTQWVWLAYLVVGGTMGLHPLGLWPARPAGQPHRGLHVRDPVLRDGLDRALPRRSAVRNRDHGRRRRPRRRRPHAVSAAESARRPG